MSEVVNPSCALTKSPPTCGPATRADILVIAGLTMLAAGLRLFGLGHESIWYDETCTLDMAAKSYGDMLTGRVIEPSNPAGYFVLLRGWMQLFGSHSIETARAFSAVIGSFIVSAVWLLARSLRLPRRAGWLGAFLVAVCPPLVYLGQEARCYALLVPLVTLALAAVAWIERDDRPLAWVAFAVVGALIVHVHYYGFFVLSVLGLHLLLWAWKQRNAGAVLRLGMVAATVALCFAHYVPAVIAQLKGGEGRAKGIWWEHLGLLPAFSVIGRTLIWKEAGRAAVLASVVFVLLSIYLPAAVLLSRAKAWPRLLPGYVIGLPVLMALISLRVSMIASHHLSVIFSALMLLLACALDAGLRSRSRGLVAVLAASLAVLMTPALARTYLVKHKTDWRSVIDEVAKNGPDLPVYFYEDIGEDPYRYYRPEQRRIRMHEEFKGGDGWKKAGYVEQLHDERRGFWFVFYGTNNGILAEEPRILDWMKGEFEVTRDDRIGPLHLIQCRQAHGGLVCSP